MCYLCTYRIIDNKTTKVMTEQQAREKYLRAKAWMVEANAKLNEISHQSAYNPLSPLQLAQFKKLENMVEFVNECILNYENRNDK